MGTRDLHSQWNGPKEIHTFPGDHNSARPGWFLAKGAQFLWDNFETEAKDKLRRTGSFSIFPVQADGTVAQMIRECVPVKINRPAPSEESCNRFGPKYPSDCSSRPICCR